MISAVLVAWQRDCRSILANLVHLRGSIASLVVVDNSALPDCAGWQQAVQLGWNVRHLANRGNLGVARALNQGIRAALDDGAELVLTLDEDSVPLPRMVEELLQAYRLRSDAGDRVAAVGANFRDRHGGGAASFARVRGARIERRSCSDPAGLIEADYLMSSGCLMPRAALEAVGPLRDDLFVDYVDIEWCWRARAQGWRCFGVCPARMEHEFGDGALPVPGLRRSVPRRAPERSYYLARNTLLLLRVRHIPWRWKLHALVHLLARAVLYLLSAPDAGRHLRLSLAGLADGARGRGGAFDDHVR
jgi:rhamnosyltransferase